MRGEATSHSVAKVSLRSLGVLCPEQNPGSFPKSRAPFPAKTPEQVLRSFPATGRAPAADGPGTVGLRIVGEDLFDRVPAEPAAGPAGDVAQVADGGRAVADLDVGHRLGAALDAVDPVPHVVLVAALGLPVDLLGDLRPGWT